MLFLAAPVGDRGKPLAGALELQGKDLRVVRATGAILRVLVEVLVQLAAQVALALAAQAVREQPHLLRARQLLMLAAAVVAPGQIRAQAAQAAAAQAVFPERETRAAVVVAATP